MISRHASRFEAVSESMWLVEREPAEILGYVRERYRGIRQIEIGKTTSDITQELLVIFTLVPLPPVYPAAFEGSGCLWNDWKQELANSRNAPLTGKKCKQSRMNYNKLNSPRLQHPQSPVGLRNP